jgi:hypothetical protein
MDADKGGGLECEGGYGEERDGGGPRAGRPGPGWNASDEPGSL